VWSVFKLAARAAIWRSTPDARLVGLPSLIGWALVLAVVRVALQYAEAWPTGAFNPYGLNAVVAWLALALVIAAMFVRPAVRATALAAMLALSALAELFAMAAKLGITFLAAKGVIHDSRTFAIATNGFFAVEVMWWLAAMACVLHSVEALPRLRRIGTVVALWAALFAGNALVPHTPVFAPRGFDVRTANWWEILYARHIEAMREAELQKQQQLLQAQVANLAPPHENGADIYVIGVAGWADQDVFVKELDGALASLGNVLPIKDRAIRLINRRETAASIPLATPRNFAGAVHAIGETMDKDQDILVLLMTSHGDPNGFALQMPSRETIDLTPQQVASTLNSEGIKNRVVIVSACYAGIFVPPLENDDTIVITAADAKSTSFGCAPERDWTYFGDALFRQSLQRGTDFMQAFDHARVLISGWELMDHVAPSNPQAHFGRALVERLKPLFHSAATSARDATR